MDKWEKLKKIIEEDIDENQKNYDESLLTEFQNYTAEAIWVLERMIELEKAD